MLNLFKLIKALIGGFTTGLIISIPLGPSAMESINRTLSKGIKDGFIVSLGAITADMSYLILINCGLSKLLRYNKTTESLFWIISGFILVLMQYSDLKRIKTQNITKDTLHNSYPFLSGFLLTFTNPMTPTLWLGLSGTIIKVWSNLGKIYYHSFIFSIFLGMVTWFAGLNYITYKGFKILKNNDSTKTSTYMKYIILFLGIGFILFGLFKLTLSLK